MTVKESKMSGASVDVSLLPSRSVIPSERVLVQTLWPVPPLLSHPPPWPATKMVNLSDPYHLVFEDRSVGPDLMQESWFLKRLIFSRLVVASSTASVISCSSVLAGDPAEGSSCQFTMWVAFFEIYNECVYDLLQSSLCPKSKKRASLRVCDDGAGNAYVKGASPDCRWCVKYVWNCLTLFFLFFLIVDLRWINIQNLGEAFKLLQYGNKNRSAAATKMNQSSSRRQIIRPLSIFCMMAFCLFHNSHQILLQP